MAVESTTLGTYAAETQAAARNFAKPISGLMKILSLLIKNDAKVNFDRSVTPDGRPWAPLRFPRARGGGAGSKPLRDRGLLMASMQGRGPNAVERISGATLEQGTNLEYANLHQYGGVIVPTGGRKFLAIPRTPEAARTPARKFPRPLRAIIGKRGGVLVEETGRKVAGVARRTLKFTNRKLSQAIARVKRGRARTGDAAAIEFLRAKQKSLRTRIGDAKSKAKASARVQYILTRRVVVPAREFLGFGQRLIGKVERAIGSFFGFGGRDAN